MRCAARHNAALKIHPAARLFECAPVSALSGSEERRRGSGVGERTGHSGGALGEDWMLLYGSALVVMLFATSIISLTAAGAQPAPSAQSMNNASLEPSRRGAWLQAVGFVSLSA